MGKFSQRERLQEAIATIRVHPRYADLSTLAEAVYGRRSINPLVVLADCLSENPLSRLLQYLFDSGASHRLGAAFYRAWAQAAALPAAYFDDVHSVRPAPLRASGSALRKI